MNPELHSAPPPPGQEWALASYIAAIRKHRLVVVLVTLAAVAASLAFLLLRSPEYEATAQLLVEPLSQTDQVFLGLPLLRDTGDPVRTVQTAAALVESQAQGGDPDREDGVKVNPEGESNILAITATAGSSEEAAGIANEFANRALAVRADELNQRAAALIEQLQARLQAVPSADEVTRASLASRIDQISSVVENGDPTLLLSQEAFPPDSATGASPPLIVVLALIAGFVLGTGTALLLEVMTRRVNDEEELLRLYELPVLARVPLLPQRSRKGPKGSMWFMPPGIREPFRTLAVQLEQRGGGRRVVMLTSPTRGDGKTTSAINLAATLAATGRRVTVLDFDLRNPQLGRALGIDDGPRLSALVDPDLDVTTVLVHPSELRTLLVLPVRFDPGEAHLSEAAAWRLPELIQEVSAHADYVIIDTPPLGEVSDALNLAPLVDDILLVARPGNTSRSHIVLMRELLDRIGLAPAGYIIMGDVERRAGRGYYGYGAGGASDLVLGAANSGRRRESETDHGLRTGSAAERAFWTSR